MPEPIIRAEFVLDEEGRPRTVSSGETKHYLIEVAVDNAPEDTYAVTYNLHKSYYDPVREVRNANERFVEQLTSYGDYVVRADVRTKTHVEPVVSDLSRALKRSYEEASPEIREALNDIESH